MSSDLSPPLYKYVATLPAGGTAHHFGVNAFEGEEHNTEISRSGRVEVFVGDIFRHLLDGRFQ